MSLSYARFRIRHVLVLATIAVLLVPLALPICAQDDDTRASTRFARAFELYAADQHARAIEAFAAFRQQFPDDAATAEALYYQAGANLALGRDEEAVRLYRRLENEHPAHPLASEAQLALGRRFYENGLYERAIDYLDEFLTSRPSDEDAAAALYWMGQAAVELGQFDRALDYFGRIEQRYRETEQAPAALYALAKTQVRLERLDDAAASFERLVARYPASPYVDQVGLGLAEVYYELGDYQRAIREVEQKRRDLSPDLRDRATFLLAESYNQLRQSDDAIIEYRKLTEERTGGPFYRRAMYGLAWNYYFQESHQWAADQFANVREGYDDELARDATYYEAVNRKLVGQTDRAMDLYREVIRQWADSDVAERALYELALGYYDERRWEEAQATFRRFVRTYPHSELRGDALRHLGSTHVALGDLEGATEAFDEAIELDAAPAELKAGIRFQKAWLQYRNRRYADAVEGFREYLDRHPDGADASQAVFWLGESMFQLGRFDEAERLLRRYIDEHPGGRHREAAHYALGWVYFKQSRYAEAAQSFETFLDRYRDAGGTVPYRTDALLRLGDSYYALKQFDRAVTAYREVADEGVDYALYQIAQASYNADRFERAADAYRSLLEQYPESPWREEAQYRLGYMQLQQQNYDAAIKAFQTLIEQRPRDPLAARAQYGIGDAHYNAGRLDEATEAYLDVLRRYSESTFVEDAASSLMYAAMASGGQQAAQRLVDRFASENPDSPLVDELRFRRAEVLYQSGQTDAARSAFLQFVRNSDATALLPEAYYYLGTLFANQDQLQEAESYLRQIIDKFPQSERSTDAAQRLAEIYVDQEQFQDALDAYGRVASSSNADASGRVRAAYGQAQALLGLGRTDEAERVLQDALEEAPGAAEAATARLGLARVYEVQNRPGEAENTYRAIVEVRDDETGAEALYRLGALLIEQGRPADAVEQLSRMNTLYPGASTWQARGLLAQARALTEMGRSGDARRLYETVVEDFSGTSYAAQARERLDGLAP